MRASASGVCVCKWHVLADDVDLITCIDLSGCLTICVTAHPLGEFRRIGAQVSRRHRSVLRDCLVSSARWSVHSRVRYGGRGVYIHICDICNMVSKSNVSLFSTLAKPKRNMLDLPRGQISTARNVCTPQGCKTRQTLVLARPSR